MSFECSKSIFVIFGNVGIEFITPVWENIDISIEPLSKITDGSNSGWFFWSIDVDQLEKLTFFSDFYFP
jgi:hypothetical protein